MLTSLGRFTYEEEGRLAFRIGKFINDLRDGKIGVLNPSLSPKSCLGKSEMVGKSEVPFHPDSDLNFAKHTAPGELWGGRKDGYQSPKQVTCC